MLESNKEEAEVTPNPATALQGGALGFVFAPSDEWGEDYEGQDESDDKGQGQGDERQDEGQGEGRGAHSCSLRLTGRPNLGTRNPKHKTRNPKHDARNSEPSSLHSHKGLLANPPHPAHRVVLRA